MAAPRSIELYGHKFLRGERRGQATDTFIRAIPYVSGEDLLLEILGCQFHHSITAAIHGGRESKVGT
jgi:hypothetical protein